MKKWLLKWLGIDPSLIIEFKRLQKQRLIDEFEALQKEFLAYESIKKLLKDLNWNLDAPVKLQRYIALGDKMKVYHENWKEEFLAKENDHDFSIRW